MKPFINQAVTLIGVAVASTSWLATPVHATAPTDNVMTVQTEKVIIFKDGYSLIIKNGSATTDNHGILYTDQVLESAVLGTFWAIPKNGQLINMQVEKHQRIRSIEEEAEWPCTQTLDIIRANQGKTGQVELHDKTTFSGIIRQVIAPRKIHTHSTDSANDVRSTNQYSSYPLRPMNRPISKPKVPEKQNDEGAHFILRTDQGDVLLPVNQIRVLTIPNMKTTLKRTTFITEPYKRLTFHFAEANKPREVQMMYLRPGVQWIPTYRIDLNPSNETKKLATISLQTEIINELEDFTNTIFDIVVGVPNFRFRNEPSPLTFQNTLPNPLEQRMQQLGQTMSNSSMPITREIKIKRDMLGRVVEEDDRMYQHEHATTKVSDLFVYHLPKLQLNNGQRAIVPIFTTTVPYRDIYTWDLHLKRQNISRISNNTVQKSPLILTKNEVWHQIELTNTTQQPWTAGSALIMQRNQPLAQELLIYTSPQNQVLIPMTVSVDTRGDVEEEELSREVNSLFWRKASFAKVTKAATLRLRNNKPRAIVVDITFHFGGKVDEASDNGQMTIDTYNQADWESYNRQNHIVNNHSTVRWNTTIEPGQIFAPKVRYHYYVR